MSELQVIRTLRRDSQKKRVAGYARVSTADEHQDSSYRLQIQELEDSIRANPRFEFIGIFKDRKSGRNIKDRQEFNTMIELAMLGEIEVIITKSITRFARNLLDTVSIVRELKINNVEVYFQKEGISTLDPSIEMILTVLAMHAEEESKNISENTNWSFKRKMRAGGNFTTYLYGYNITKGVWTINENEAAVVRLIFDWYLKNFSYRQIINKLFKLGIKTSTGKDHWATGTIEQMLRNEKYAGHMSLGKSHESNGVRVRSTRLENDESMIMNHHDPIISPTVFDRAMAIRDERAGESKRIYVPHLGRTSPFYTFVYSIENSKFLNYRIERPKNKYEIPTLYCYDKHRKNRVSMTVENLFLLLNNALGKLSQQSHTLNSEINNLLDQAINQLIVVGNNVTEEKLEPLTKKVSLNNAKNRLLNFIKQIKHFSNMNEVEEFKRLVRVVEMVDRQTYNIRLALVEDNSLDFCLLNSKITLKVGAKNRDVSFFIYL